MTAVSVLGQELKHLANTLFNGDLSDGTVREKVLIHKVSKKFGAKGQSAIDSFLQSTSPSLHPNLSNREIAIGSVAGLESVVAVHLRLAGG